MNFDLSIKTKSFKRYHLLEMVKTFETRESFEFALITQMSWEMDMLKRSTLP